MKGAKRRSLTRFSRRSTLTIRRFSIGSSTRRRRSFAGSVCESAFSEALSAMIAYRPGKEVLAALDQEADTKRAKSAPPVVASATPTGGVSTDEAGVVVTPSVASGAGLVKVVAIEPYGSRTERGLW